MPFLAGTYIDLPTPAQNASGLTVTLPSSAPYGAGAYVLKLTFSGTKHFERVEFGDVKTTLDYDWTMSITFKRI